VSERREVCEEDTRSLVSVIGGPRAGELVRAPSGVDDATEKDKKQLVMMVAVCRYDETE
jgi:hypothetical protein